MTRPTVPLETAIAMLPVGEEIHTFMNPAAGLLLGADWDRADVVEALRKAKEIYLSGEAAAAMDHGLAVVNGGQLLFIATRSEKA